MVAVAIKQMDQTEEIQRFLPSRLLAVDLAVGVALLVALVVVAAVAVQVVVQTERAALATRHLQIQAKEIMAALELGLEVSQVSAVVVAARRRQQLLVQLSLQAKVVTEVHLLYQVYL